MLAQRVISGSRDCYVGTVTLKFIKRAIEHSLPLKENMFPHLEIEEEEKAIDEINKLILDRIAENSSWWMGGFSFAVYSFPIFQPLSLQDYENEDTAEWGILPLKGDGPEIWVPLDGYQRMKGMFKALSVLSGKQRQLLAEDRIPVLLIPAPTLTDCYDLLLRMHKSARAIDRGETIRTTIDDYATYSRWMMGEDKEHPEVIKKDLINWKSNTLTNRLCKFSTLSVLYDSAKMLDQELKRNNAYRLKDKEERYNDIVAIWKLLLERFSHFREAVSGFPEQLPRQREQFLCLKPTGQLVIVAIMALALRKELPLEQVVARLDMVSWRMDNSLWQDIIVIEGRVNGTKASITLASSLVAHLIGFPLNDIEVQTLEQAYRKGKREENAILPKPLCSLLNQE